MPFAFALSAPARSLAPPRHAHTAAVCPPRMVSASRPMRPAHVRIVPDEEPAEKPVVEAPEVTAVAATVCEFMNHEHIRDLAQYVVRFGQKFDDLSQLTRVRMTAIDAMGFTADVVSCDDTSHCVCVQERLDWPLGLCHNAGDILNAFKYLSAACGLPADF